MEKLLFGFVVLIALLLALILLVLSENTATVPVSRSLVRFVAASTAVVSGLVMILTFLSAISS